MICEGGEFRVSISGNERICIAQRKDAPWGHGLQITILAQGELPQQSIKFLCHPDFAEFEKFQAMNTDELLQCARDRLASGAYDKSLALIAASGVELLTVFNAPDQESAT